MEKSRQLSHFENWAKSFTVLKQTSTTISSAEKVVVVMNPAQSKGGKRLTVGFLFVSYLERSKRTRARSTPDLVPREEVGVGSRAGSDEWRRSILRR
jgi:hypothetical protein